jgi:cytochrome c-type biogenesis protein CcmE
MQSFQRLFTSTLLLCIIFYPNFLNGQLTAIIKYEYYSSLSNYSNITQEIQTNGIISTKGSQSMVQNKQAFTLMDSNGKYDACQQTINPRIYSNGIAIIQRGGDCTFSVKITRAKNLGASGNSEIHLTRKKRFKFSCYYL